MDSTVFYFSATGNSLAAARAIAERIGAGAPVEMTAALASGAAKTGCRRLGLVFPLYYQSYPTVVRRFVEELEAGRDTDIFAVVTRGFKPTGGVLAVLAADLKRKGLALRYAAYLDMPNDDLTVGEPFSRERCERILAKAERSLERIASEIAEGKKRGSRFEPLALIRPLREKAYRKLSGRAHLAFSAGSACTGCGTCVKACALRRIRIAEGRPRWSEGCQLCEACLNLCPARAIVLAGSGSERKGRYRHPKIGMAELLARKG
jgi:formate hydrogenlyase subunit 6/NADH:ubiquinone oxidoreductase subunit I